jgi:hypothetical protein
MTNRQWLRYSAIAKWAFETLFFCIYYQWQHKQHVVAYVNKKLTWVLPRRLSAQYENEREASKPCVTQLLTVKFILQFRLQMQQNLVTEERRRKEEIIRGIHSFIQSRGKTALNLFQRWGISFCCFASNFQLKVRCSSQLCLTQIWRNRRTCRKLNKID